MTERFDLVFRGAIVIDGTGAAASVGDVGVVGDRIVTVGTPIETVIASEVIDASGLVLAPGFIDIHTHDDWALLLEPDLGFKTLQGVTSVVTGNCGSSAFPDGERRPGRQGFSTMAEYFARLDEIGPAVNVASLVGHGEVRAAVMGLRTRRDSTRAERAAMADFIGGALADGAVGLSSGLAYEPGRYAEPDELVELAHLVSEVGGIYTTHMRDEADGLLDSIRESIAVAERAEVPLQISHLKASGRRNWGRAAEALRLLDRARAQGVDVMADQYPYTRGSTLLEQLVNAGALDGPSPFGFMTPADILVAAAPDHPHWTGRTIQEIAAESGIDGREMADRIVAEAGRSCFVVIDTMSEDDVRTVMVHPAVMVGSDGVPAGEKPHPRLHHTFPRVLGHYCRELGLLDLPGAVHRMTGMPARRFGFDDRGIVEPGAFADLVLFDPDAVLDTGTYAEPTTVPIGVQGVWVNGQRVVETGVITGVRPGRTIRH